MTDPALAHLLRLILKARDKTAAEKLVDGAGADYLPLVKNLVARLTFKRTLSQNALIHVWFDEIAKHRGDVTAFDVKGELHRKFGLPIRLRNPQFAWVWHQTGAALDYEKQCKLLACGVLNVSSGMTKKELKEYADEIQREYSWLEVKEAA